MSLASKAWCAKHMAQRIGPLVAMLLLSSGVSTRAWAEPRNLLAGLRPIRSQGVKNVDRLTDNLMSVEGDGWLTDVTARFSSARSFVEYDLGSPQVLHCVLVQADNNDVYFMSGSLDGQSFGQLWRVGTDPGAGMRVRSVKLESTVRYLRLSATGGDALYSVS